MFPPDTSPPRPYGGGRSPYSPPAPRAGRLSDEQLYAAGYQPTTYDPTPLDQLPSYRRSQVLRTLGIVGVLLAVLALVYPAALTDPVGTLGAAVSGLHDIATWAAATR